MRTIPILAALFVATAAFPVGSAAMTPTAGEVTPSHSPLHGQSQGDVPNASFERLVLAEASASMTVDEMTVDRLETDRGTFENVMLEDASVTITDATVVVSNVSAEDGDVEHAFVDVEEGEVTIEEATATANGDEFTIDDVTMTVENESADSGVESAESSAMRMDADELRQLVEGATIEEVSIDGVSADADIVLASIDGVEFENGTGFASLGGVVLDSFEDGSMTAESAHVEDGTLVLENAEMSVEEAQLFVDIGVTGMGEDVRVMDNVEIEIDDTLTIERDEIRLHLW